MRNTNLWRSSPGVNCGLAARAERKKGKFFSIKRKRCVKDLAELPSSSDQGALFRPCSDLVFLFKLFAVEGRRGANKQQQQLGSANGCDEFRRRSDNGDATTKTCNDDEVKVPSLAFYLPFLLAPTRSPQIVFAHAAIRDTRQTQKETGPRRIKRYKKPGETWQKTRFMRQKQRGHLKERRADRIEKISNFRDVRRFWPNVVIVGLSDPVI